ncbi:MAG: flavodoxin [Clostridiaceae bacterium]|jgi:flavodoxin|nr:flavodoxin [Clostridiaceae bacterium]
MKVGVICYSNTGNTLSVAQKVEQALAVAGHTVQIEQVEPVSSEIKPGTPVTLKTAPDPSPYDVVILASPVHAFSLAPVMKLYLSRLPGLANKPVHCFVTQHLKKAWMGGNHAVRQIRAGCKSNGAELLSSGIVNWSSSQRDQQIESIVDRLRAL